MHERIKVIVFDEDVHGVAEELYGNQDICKEFENETRAFLEEAIIDKKLLKAIWLLNDKETDKFSEFVIHILQKYMTRNQGASRPSG